MGALPRSLRNRSWRDRNHGGFASRVLLQQGLKAWIVADRIPIGIKPQHHGRVVAADAERGQRLGEQRYGKVGRLAWA